MLWLCAWATLLGPRVAEELLGAVAPAPNEDTSLSSWLGPTSEGAAAAPTAGGAVAAPTARVDAPERVAKRDAVREQWGRALDATFGDGSVGRKRVALSPEPVSFGDKGSVCASAQVLTSDSGCDFTRSVAVE